MSKKIDAILDIDEETPAQVSISPTISNPLDNFSSEDLQKEIEKRKRIKQQKSLRLVTMTFSTVVRIDPDCNDIEENVRSLLYSRREKIGLELNEFLYYKDIGIEIEKFNYPDDLPPRWSRTSIPYTSEGYNKNTFADLFKDETEDISETNSPSDFDTIL